MVFPGAWQSEGSRSGRTSRPLRSAAGQRPLIKADAALRGVLGKIIQHRPHVRVEIADAVAKLFKVDVAKVNTINVRGQARRMGRYSGYTAAWKKAIVTLKADSKPIEFFDGLI